MNFKPAAQNDERAVSPVIGVILMVAITVILAAVIGTFVLGLGDQLGNSQPTAQLNVADASSGNVTIEHTGGDPVNTGDLQVVLRNGNTEVESATDLTTIGIVSEEELSVGGSIQLGYSNSTGDDVDNVRLIHTPSESIILDEDVDTFDFSSWE